MPKFEPGSWLWIQDEIERYLPAKVLSGFETGTATTVRTEDGEDHNLNAEASAWATECSPEILDSKIEDLINISDLSEMAILHSLRIRFREDKIYTNISSILISVNPFRLLPLFTPEVLAQYRDGNPRELAPHIFTSANAAYKGMLNDKKDQSVVISGESGAGKSEAMKLILQFLTDVSARADGANASKDDKATATTTNLEQKILAANPILEAFGNAKTSRNNNSSRFGKLITINFDTAGAIIGGGIINYLLEKSRVVSQNLDERNYHIFYQLATAASDPVLAAELKLQSPELFAITNPEGKGVVTIPNHSDEKEFEDTNNSFRVLKFTETEKMETFKIVSGVLHFGNVQFIAKTEESCVISNPETLEHAAKMFGIDVQSANKCLTSRLMGAHSIVVVNYSVEQAQAARDAMIKRVYSDLFQIMVDRINTELSSGGKTRTNFIGVLDIFGFESFEVNSFEQLCINYCNEKLQFHFNEHIFKMEQSLYADEKIVIPGSSFVDNQSTLDLLELKVTGVFAMTDEEISVPRGSDDGLLSKLLTKHKDHDHMVAPRGKVCNSPQKCFGIDHYAGTVYYNISSFLEKNKDQLHPDIAGVLSSSDISMIHGMFNKKSAAADDDSSVTDAPAASGGRRGGASKSKQKTLGGQFKDQLVSLLDTLNTTEPNFVRCMKSNDKKCGRLFDSKRMQDQLRYSGLVEVCRIRKLGFPVRRDFDDFFRRYRCVDLSCKNLDSQLTSLTTSGMLVNGEWAKGVSRIFLRTGQNVELEVHREKCLTLVATTVQKCMRRVLSWWHFKRMLLILKELKACQLTRDEIQITEALSSCAELPWNGSHVQSVKDCKLLLSKVRAENAVLRLVEAAVESKDLSTLNHAINEATKHVGDATTPKSLQSLLIKAQNMVKQIEIESACKAGMISSCVSKNLPDLAKYIAEAVSLSLTSLPQYTTCLSVQKTRQEEEAALEDLSKAGDDLDNLTAAITKCNNLGINSHSKVVAAVAIRTKILTERSAAEQEAQRALENEAILKRKLIVDDIENRLQAAMSDNNANAINSLLSEAIRHGVESDIVTKAKEQNKSLSMFADVRSNLIAAIKVLKVKATTLLTTDDFNDLIESINKAKLLMAELSMEFSDLTKAEKSLQDFQQHIPHYPILMSAIMSGDRIELKEAVSIAENLDMETDDAITAKEMLREAEINYREEKTAAGESLEPEVTEANYDEAEEARRAKREVAKQAKFEYKNFMNLRTLDDFARGYLLSKTRVKESMLVFSDQALPKSLTKLDAVKNKRALEIQLNIQGYMGDRHMPYPAMLAQDVLKTAVSDKDLRDEVFCQIIKQLSKNTRAESVAKGWQLMCMCVGTFPPSFDMEYYLLHYIVNKTEVGRGAVVDYARYCLRTLEAMLSSGDFNGGYVPSTEEILSYKERPPILATITLVDGNEVIPELPVTPDVNVGRILTLCCNWLSLTDTRLNTLGIFVYDDGPIDASVADTAPYAYLERTPRALRNEDFMGDVTVLKARQKRKFRFVLKRKLFLPSSLGRGDDDKFDRLTYMQAEDDCLTQGTVNILDADTVANLAAISMTIAFAVDIADSVETMGEQEHMTFIAPLWRDEHTSDEWATKILGYTEGCVGIDNEELQEMFVSTLQQNGDNTYGSHWFNVKLVGKGVGKCKDFPTLLKFGFCHVGLEIYTESYELLTTYPYSEIYRWGGSSTQFSLILGDSLVTGGNTELVVITAQAQDMAAIVLDHIRALMKEEKK